jgi:rsbT co-antagonist protein RsbR
LSQENPAGLRQVLENDQDTLLKDWVEIQLREGARSGLEERQLREHSREFLTALRTAMKNGGAADLNSPDWAKVRDLLASISETRAAHGFTAVETATFIFSLKQPVFSRIRETYANNPELMVAETWASNKLLDKLGLHTTDLHQKSREKIIISQQEELLELSTPVVQLWEGIVALPLIGTLDSARTQIVMQNLLDAIVKTGSEIAIIDITGVPTVDTLVAQHLLKTVAAARLMGAECLISGIRPQIAQTIVHLGVELNNVVTKATLADAFAFALARAGLSIQSSGKQVGA